MKKMYFKKALLALAASFFFSSLMAQDITSGLQLHYNFKEADGVTIKDQVGSNDGTLVNDATVGSDDAHNYLDLIEVEEGITARPYLDLGAGTGAIISQLTDFTISFFMKVPTGYKSDFTWNFSNSEDINTEANGHMFFDCVHQKTVITPTHHDDEVGNSINLEASVPTDVWFHYTFTMEAYEGKYYVDAIEKGAATFGTLPADLGATQFNWIGRCAYDTGGDLAGQYNVNPAQIADFRIYNRALAVDEIVALSIGEGEKDEEDPGDNTGINEADRSFNIYPNPVLNELRISNAQGSHIAISNLFGQVILEAAINNNQQIINTSNLATGVYLVNITKDNKTTIVKMLKK